MRLMKLYGLQTEGAEPPDSWPWKGSTMAGTEQQAAQLLRRAVTNGKPVPAPRTVFGTGSKPHHQTNLIWKLDDLFVGANVHDGWPLVWSCPVSGTRIGLGPGIQKPGADANSNIGSPQSAEIDPWSDMVDDFATAIHWISPEEFADIMGEGD